MLSSVLAACLVSHAAFEDTVLAENLRTEYANISLIRRVGGLNRPWAVAFPGENQYLITERGGRLLFIDESGAKHEVSGLPDDLVSIRQGGLLDVVLHPNFEGNGWTHRTLLTTRAQSSASGTTAPCRRTILLSAIPAICRKFSAMATASRQTLMPEEVPVGLNVLDTAAIQDSPALTVDDFLRQAPGVSLFRRTSSLTANPTAQGFTLRGIGPSGTSRGLVLYDGAPLNDAFGGWEYWSRIDLRNADQIEVAVEGRAFQTDGYVRIRGDQRGGVDTPANSRHESLSAILEHQSPEGAFFRGRLTYFNERRNNGTPLTANNTESWRWQHRYEFESSASHVTTWTGFAEHSVYASTFSRVNADRSAEQLVLDQFRVPATSAGTGLTQERAWGAGQLVTLGTDFRWVEGETRERVVAPNLRRVAGGEQNDIEDSIANVTLGPNPLGGADRQQQNLGRARVRGIEWEGRVQAAPVMELFSRHALLDSTILGAPGQADRVGNRLAQVPRNQGTLGVRLDLTEKARLTPQLRYESARFENDTNTRRLAGFYVIDLLYRQHINDSLTLRAGVENLLNRRYANGIIGDDLTTLGHPRLITLAAAVSF